MRPWEEADKNENEEMLLDRLVDGELDESERRDLLAAFDQRPEGWRRCALTFLESQQWGQTMKEMTARPIDAAASTAAAPVRLASRPALRPAWLGWLAVAASFVVAFALGLYLRGKLFSDVPPLPGVEIAETPGDKGPTPILPADAQLVDHPADSIPGVRLIDNAGSHDRDSMVVVIENGPGGQTKTIRLPVVEAGPLESMLPWDGGAALSPDLVQQLRQRGHHIQRHRRIAPLQLDDGRRMMVPVEDVEIMPVNRRMY